MSLSKGLPTENRMAFKVAIDPSGDAFRKAAKWEHSEMVRVTRFQQTNLVPELDDVVKYCKTLMYIRTNIVHNNSSVFNSYTYRGLYVPTRMYTIIHHIGIALNTQMNIKLTPVYEIDADDLLSPSEMRDISDKLEMLKPEGYSCIKGIQRTEVGVFETMLSWCLEVNTLTKILSYKADHPMHAMIAGILGITPVEKGYADVALLVRADYGTLEHLEDNLISIYKEEITEAKEKKAEESTN